MTVTTLPPRPVLKPHQQIVHDFLMTRPFAAAWLKPGDGKTLTVLQTLLDTRPSGHILVIAPLAIARSTWVDEIEKWGFPIRTKSLIVDENDRPLNKKKQLQAFRDVTTDPPSMYFINKEMLTRPSQTERLLTTVSGASTSGMTKAQATVFDLLHDHESITQDELIDIYRELVDPHATKKLVRSTVKELIDSRHIDRASYACRACAGKGCHNCRFGLIDQMPTTMINGKQVPVWQFPNIIIDEAQGFKSHASERFKALKKMRPAVDHLVELTGTPTPNGLHDLWSQMYLLDQGQTLGKNITAFRERWFTPKMVPGTSTPAKWIPRLGAEQEIQQLIAPYVISAENTTSTVPDLTIENINVTLPADVIKAYDEFKQELVLELVAEYQDENGQMQQSIESVVAENQAVLSAKLLQFASGTLYTSDPDDPDTAGRYEVIHDQKLEMLDYLICNTGNSPVLLAYHFRSDLEQIEKHLAAKHIDAHVFDGSRNMVRQWNAGRIPVMIIHPASAGHGLNLQDGGHTMIFYTLTENLEWYQQTVARLHRTGQTRPVTVYRLLAKGTRDTRIPTVLDEKARQQTELVESVDRSTKAVSDTSLDTLTDELLDHDTFV